MIHIRGVAAVLLLAGCGGTMRSAEPPAIAAAEWEALLAAEDARARADAQLEVLHTALRSDNPAVRAIAVRALGRTERSGLAPVIRPLLRDPIDSVRAAAAHALADVTRDTASGQVRAWVLEALPAAGETGAGVAALAETLGRLRADAAAARTVAARLTPFLAHDNDARRGALRGLYFLVRQPAARSAVNEAAAATLRVVSGGARGERERGLAIAILAAAQAADAATLSAALGDAAAQVRREAAAAAATLEDTAAVSRLAATALRDAEAAVRYEAVRVYARRLAAARGCAPVTAAARDRDPHVSLLAIDLLGTTCAAPAVAPLLDSIAGYAPRDDWHHAAHAVVALAAIDPAAARVRARSLARHPSPFPRAYAARAAGAAGDTALLYRLASDTSANVRSAATASLAALAGHGADSTYIAQLASNEIELLMTAAAALEGSTNPRAAGRLLDAFDRVTALRRETSRDARIALLERVQELGSPALTDRVRPYLRDFDAAVAARAAAVLEAWTGTRPQTAPQPLPSRPLPTYDEAVRLANTTFVLEMASGGEIAIRLLPFTAPANAARFARLARAGYFDGLTTHRVAPNFVVQGGSPGANEYSGDGPFTRDELGAPNWRGTVGLSTRGRDTGDAQFYINLIDNVRLDHDYTVFGIVASGMDVVDALREGAVIRRVREVAR